MKKVTASEGHVTITCDAGSKVSGIRVGDDWIVRQDDPWYVRAWNWCKSLVK